MEDFTVSAHLSMRDVQTAYARWMLAQCGGNKRQACLRLEIARHTLEKYLNGGHYRGSGQAKAWKGEPEKAPCGLDHEGPCNVACGY